MSIATFRNLPMPREFQENPLIEGYIRAMLEVLEAPNSVTWATVDKQGSRLLDIEQRPHSALQDILGADASSTDTTQNKHVSDAQIKALTDATTGAASDVDLQAHINTTSGAHGATGALVGVGDTATTGVAGVVLQAADVDDVATADPGAASMIYVQAELQAVIDLAIETKAQFNALQASLRAAGTLETP